MKNYSNLDPTDEDGDGETWIDNILSISLHNHNEDGEGCDEKYEELWYSEGVGEREVDEL